jgi:hypothetical protein
MFVAFLFTSTQAPGHANKPPSVPTVSVPKIAQFLSVRVGFNGQKALENSLGQGRVAIGGHPNSRQMWRTERPSGLIETDGFWANNQGYIIEVLYWGEPLLRREAAIKIPLVKRRSLGGWLGVVYLGMTKEQVSRLIHGKLPKPVQGQGGQVWEWKQTGFLRVNRQDAIRVWRARLVFQKRGKAQVLTEITVMCG